jgi:hypothetical protein
MAARSKSQEVEKQFPSIPAEALGEITSFADAVSLAQNVYGADNVVEAADVLGDGFRMVENKSTLIGTPFFAVSWNFSAGDHGEFVAVKLVTQDDRKLVITDGGAGIYQMLANYSKSTGRYGGLFVRKGLRKSDYQFENERGEMTSATTFYLDVSA